MRFTRNLTEWGRGEVMLLQKLFLSIAAAMGFLGVAIGAFGAHALKQRLAPEMMVIYEVGERYHMYHCLALLAVAWAVQKFPHYLVTTSGWLFFIGAVLFSGSLYTLAITGERWWGAITPIGGVLLLLGWLCLFVGTLRS